ncbi:unnamed protein product [Cuscuta campestris]|uniref:Retrovirus-related Pol polyprotein from transposon TNT 1-94-like beta-barrel domain-containing protein n=1 Tax=Cuscuta campestris TaxID=132261 RepID=A0A484NKS7_9ASTE|nr:unnamed protein product [Cuscuta campestris]
MEAHGSSGVGDDPVDFDKMCGVQHREGEDYDGSLEGPIKYIRETICNEQDEIKVLILLSSLPESWDNVITAISISRGSKKLRFDEIRDVVLSETENIGDALILSVDNLVQSWILDSGASFHSSPSKELFQNFKSENFGKVFLVDNKALMIEEKWNVCIKTPEGNHWTLEDVKYIPGLKKNLIPIPQLDSTDYAARFGKSYWKIGKGVMVVARGTKFGTLYTTAWCINMVADADGASEPEVEHVTPERVLRRSSRTIRAPDKYSPSLHYLLLTDEGELESFDEALQHIRKRYHFTRRAVDAGDMSLEKIEGAKNSADMLTKCADVRKLRFCKTSVGLL